MSDESYLLGIDLGTSKAAAVILDRDNRQLAVQSAAHEARQAGESGRAYQNSEQIFQATETVVRNLPEKLRSGVAAIGITGQMHGVVLVDENLKTVSPLITWQDERCLEGEFLKQIKTKTGYDLCSGFGCATLAWLVEHHQLPPQARHGCTIMDLLAARLCGLSKPVTDPTNASAWGLFNLDRLEWDIAAVTAAGISAELLPKLVSCGSEAGRLTDPWAKKFGIPAGIPVAAALGDNQASLLATLDDPDHDMGLTLGTGGQLSAVLKAGARPEPFSISRSYEYRPYPGGRYMAAACSLCGGSAWQWLAEVVESWLKDFKIDPPPRDRIYQRLNELGWNAPAALNVQPKFIGQRHDPARRATIAGIGSDNFDLGTLSASLAAGIGENLKEMLPAAFHAGRQRIIGSGNALRRNALLRQAVERVFELPMQMSSLQEEAACGAAMNAQGLIR